MAGCRCREPRSPRRRAAGASARLGLPHTSTIAFGNPDKFFRASSLDLYIADDWRIRAGLTANVGVRWEYDTPVSERFNWLVNLDVARDFSAALPVLAGESTGPVTGRPLPASLVRPDRLGFQPRLGLAWRPLAASSIVIRGGYGIYRVRDVYQSIAALMAQQPPLSTAGSLERSESVALTLADGFPLQPDRLHNTFAVDPEFRPGYAHNWQASIQRDLPRSLTMMATYLGTKGSRLVQQFLPNVEVNYFQLNRAEYFVPVAVKIPGSELSLARRRGNARTELDIIGEVKDSFGLTVQNMRDRLDIRLDEEAAGQLAARPLQYETGFSLLPGSYVLKLLVRDAVTGRIGTYQTPFTIPNLMREEQRIPTSTVVLAAQRVPLDAAVHEVQQRIDGHAASPLAQDGWKLLPSVTRVFSASRDLHVFLQAYQRSIDPVQPLVAYVTFYRDGDTALATRPLLLDEVPAGRANAVSLRVSLPLAGLPPGQYECQVTVIDPATQKAAFWQAPIVVVP